MPERNADAKEKLSQRYPFIAVVGPVGIGKTTFTELLTGRIDITQLQEPYKENPYLHDFYTKNPADHSFDCQMFFLANKGVQTKKIRELTKNTPVVQDPGVEVDFMIAETQWKMGWMSDEEHLAYVSAFNIVFKDSLNPDVYIALKAKEDTVIERIIKRGREMELTMYKKYPDYFPSLVREFNIWLETKQKSKDNKIFVMDTESFDFSQGEKEKAEIVKEAVNRSGYFIAAPTQRNMVGSDGAKLIMPNSFRTTPYLVDRVLGGGLFSK